MIEVGKMFGPYYPQAELEPPCLSNKSVPAHEFLDQAASTLKDRASQRDTPSGERSMARTVTLFNAYAGTALTESDGWAFMVFLKMIRGSQGKFRDDDYVDGAGYMALLGESQSKI